MESIETRIDTHAPQFKENTAHYKSLVQELRERIATIKQGSVSYHTRLLLLGLTRFMLTIKPQSHRKA